MKISAVKIQEGEEYPRGYGFAYMDNAYHAVCHPVPFNWIVWAWHHFILFLKNPPPHRLDQLKRREYERGYKDGRKDNGLPWR